MSADNWTICPRCKIKREAACEKERARIQKLYGKVSAEEYVDAVSNPKFPPEVGQTLREDYRIGVDEYGEWSMVYRCSCKECGFRFEREDKCDAQKAGL